MLGDAIELRGKKKEKNKNNHPSTEDGGHLQGRKQAGGGGPCDEMQVDIEIPMFCFG